jgi:hypothetical protein
MEKPAADINDHVEQDTDWSMFQVKYVEFVEDALGALPEYHAELLAAKGLEEKVRLARFQAEVQVTVESMDVDVDADEKEDAPRPNPGTILPGVTLSDAVWGSLSKATQRAIQEHLRILSICGMMEGMSGAKPVWMEEMMKEMKEKLDSVDMSDLMKKFSAFFASEASGDSKEDGGDAAAAAGAAGVGGFSFPKLPERFLKGQLAKLAQEIVKDITPEDLGISPEQIAECEKNPSNAFHMLFTTFTKSPGILQRTIAKIGKRLQQKIVSGAIRPQEIAKEAEELMKEFAGNASFVEMMEGLKGAFGMEDMDVARAAGRESSARLSMVRDRLRKKLEKRANAASAASSSVAATAATAAASSQPANKSSKKKK